MATLRPARLEDLPAVTAIYNDAVARTTGTFDTEPKTLAQQREWFEHHAGIKQAMARITADNEASLRLHVLQLSLEDVS